MPVRQLVTATGSADTSSSQDGGWISNWESKRLAAEAREAKWNVPSGDLDRADRTVMHLPMDDPAVPRVGDAVHEVQVTLDKTRVARGCWVKWIAKAIPCMARVVSTAAAEAATRFMSNEPAPQDCFAM